MPFEISPVTADEMKAWVTVISTGFANSAPNRAMLPRGSTPESIAHSTARDIKNLTKPDTFYLKIIDPDTGEVASGARWHRHDGEKAASQNTDDDFSSDANVEAFRYFFGVLNKGKQEVMGDRVYWELDVLVTLPSHERKGYGKAMVLWGIEKAEQEGLPCYLCGSSFGRPMYERCGFKPMKEMHLDFKEFGVEEGCIETAMVREPVT